VAIGEGLNTRRRGNVLIANFNARLESAARSDGANPIDVANRQALAEQFFIRSHHHPIARRVELDLPGQLAREIVGYPVPANSPFLRRGLIPNWARPTLVVRNEEILTPAEADPVRAGDYVYLLAPPEKAQALDRFFVNMPPPASPDPRLLGDFFVSGDVTLGALAEIYGLQVAADHMELALADFFTEQLRRPAKTGDIVQLGPIALLAHKVANGRVTTVGLRLAEPEEAADLVGRLKSWWTRLQRWIG